jgi:hypothetical protein
MLVTSRPRGFPMQDDERENEAGQGSLFAPESVAPPARSARPPGATPDPFAPPVRKPVAPPEAAAGADALVSSAGSTIEPETDAFVSPADPVVEPETRALVSSAGSTIEPETDALVSPAGPEGDELAAPPEYLADPDADALVEPAMDPAAEPARDLTPHRRAVPLAGPTLDDVVSRVWEGMRAEVSTPCPVCHTDVEPSMHGRCGACGSTLD